MNSVDSAQKPDEVEAAARKKKICGGIGVALLCSGLFHTYLLVKLTPVYTATECGHQEAELKDFSVGIDSIHVGLEIQVSCSNPNPYKIDILSSTPGRVFVGRESRLLVGKLSVIPGSYLPEEGSGKVRVAMNADISGEETGQLLPNFLADSAVPILMELKFNVGVYISFGLGSWGTVAPFEKACALKMMGLLVNQFVSKEDTHTNTRLGPLVCRDKFEHIIIPEIGEEDETPKDGNMGFSAAQVAPTEVEAGETVKNISLGTVILLSFLTGAVLVYTTFVGEIPLPPLPTLPSLSSTTSTVEPLVRLADQPPALQPLVAKEDDGEDEEEGLITSPSGFRRPRYSKDMRDLGSPTAQKEAMFRAAGGGPAQSPSKGSKDKVVPLAGRQDSSMSSLRTGATPDRPGRDLKSESQERNRKRREAEAAAEAGLDPSRVPDRLSPSPKIDRAESRRSQEAADRGRSPGGAGSRPRATSANSNDSKGSIQKSHSPAGGRRSIRKSSPAFGGDESQQDQNEPKQSSV